MEFYDFKAHNKELLMNMDACKTIKCAS